MPRLPRGLFKRYKNAYYVRKRVDGVPRWISLGTDEEEATRRFRAMEKPVGPRLIRDAAAEWLETYIRTQRNPQNQKLAAQRAEDYLIEFLGYRKVSAVTENDIRKYRVWLEGKVSVQTVHHILSDLRCFLLWAGVQFPRRMMPRLQERAPDRLSDEQVSALLTAPEPYFYTLRLLLEMGLRWGEAIRAQGSDIQGEWLVLQRDHMQARQTRV